MVSLSAQDGAGDFLEIILTRTDDQEFVGVSRRREQEAVVSLVDSGRDVAEVLKRLLFAPPSQTPTREQMI